MAIELYPHNQETYEKMTKMFKTSTRVGIVQPTGTGKSFLFLKWIEDHPQDTFAVLSPSTEIFTQLQEYAEASGITALLNRVQMVSYQALLRMTDEEVRAIRPDKMVLDEFHRTGAERWGPSLQRLLDANPTTQVLGASATPVRYLDDSKDMASELFDRNLAIEMTLGEAVQRKILPTPTYVPVWYDLDDTMNRYENDIAHISNIQERRELEKKLAQLKRRLESSYGAEEIFQKHMPHDHGKFLVFCRNKEHLEEMKEILCHWISGVNSNVRSYVSISAQEDKDLQLEAFKADQSEDTVKLLFTIDRLNEGLHVKGIDGVIMLRPTSSPIIYLQQMGRALSVGHVNPLIFDLVNNYQSVQIPLKDGSSINVFEKEFLDSMRNNGDQETFRIFEDMVEFTHMFLDLESKLYFSFDEKWERNFKVLEQYVAEYGKIPQWREIYNGVNIGNWCNQQRFLAQRHDYPQERYEKLKAIGLMDTTFANQWERKFKLLEQFISEFNRFPKDKEEYEGVKLGQWCFDQKKDARKSSFPSERVDMLLAIGLLDATLDNRWEQNYVLLEQFLAEFGRLPKVRETYQGFGLGHWCNAQKRRAKNTSKFPPDRLKKLTDIGLLGSVFNARWEQYFKVLEQYVAEYGKIPHWREIYNGVNIGNWCNQQRHLAQKSNFPQNRLKKLQAIGLMDTTLANQWEKNYALLEQFLADFGREPKREEIYQGVNLGAWAINQRTAFKNGILSEERKQKLLAVGFMIDLLDVSWQEKFDLYKTFITEFGRSPHKKEIYQGVNLGAWANNQRTAFKNGTLSEERKQKLLAVGFMIDLPDVSWQEKFDLYKTFITEFGRSPHKKEIYQGVNLGAWANNQRTAFKNGTLSEVRKQKLLEAGFDIDPLEMAWQKYFELYLEFKRQFEREPFTNEIFMEEKLGSWVFRQRQAFKKGTLSEEKKQKLLGSGFIF